jgi:hypothetical protein
MYVVIMKKKQYNKECDVNDEKSLKKEETLMMYLISSGDKARQPGYFVTKSGRDFTEKELLTADKLMKDIKNYSLETGQSAEELIQRFNETVIKGLDDEKDEEN